MRSAHRTETVIFCIVLLLAVLALVGYDYKEIAGLGGVDDRFQVGRVRWALLGAGAWACWEMSKNYNLAWVLFFGWTGFMWAAADFEAYGASDVLLTGGCLVLGEGVRTMLRDSVTARAIGWLAVLQAVIGFGQMAGVDPVGFVDNFDRMPWGTIGHHTFLGPFCALGAVYWAQATPRLNIPAVVCACAVLATGSTMSILALLAGYLYLLARKSLKAAAWTSAVGFAGFGAFFLVSPNHDFFSMTGRHAVWPKVVKAWIDTPWSVVFGHGPGFWHASLPLWGADKSSMGQNWNRAHNDFLQLLPELGVLGFLIVAVGLFFYFRKTWKLSPLYGAWGLMLCVNASGNFTMHTAGFGLIAGWLVQSVYHRQPE